MIRVGSEVFVKGRKSEGRRRVERLLTDIPGGVKLDRPVGLFYLWNKRDLIEAGSRRLTPVQSMTLRFFRGTGEYVGKDSLFRGRFPKRSTKLRTLLALRRRGLLEHFCADNWYLTDAGREFLHDRRN